MNEAGWRGEDGKLLWGGCRACTAHAATFVDAADASQSARTKPALPWTSRAAALPAAWPWADASLNVAQ